MKILEEIIKDLNEKTVTSQELVLDCFKEIEAKDPEIHAFLRTYKEEAFAKAQASDERRAIGQPLSPLDGIPVAIKDNISYKGHVVSAGSKVLEDYEAPYDATVVTKLNEAGAIIVGALNMDEFAMGSSGENSAFGATKNPHDSTRVPGGSSSGAAASVAAKMVPLSFGSDTGGSIRQPAAFCGVVGLKPTYGAVSRYGLLAMASSLDQIGPIAQTVDGAKIGYDVIKGFDSADSTSRQIQEVKTKDTYVIGVPKQFFGEGLDNRIKDILEQKLSLLEKAGHTIKRDSDIPMLAQSVEMYYLIVPAEVSSNLARYDGIRFGLHGDGVIDSRSRGFGPEVKRRIMLGTYVLSAGYADKYYKRAQSARALLKQQLEEVFDSVDVLFGPVTPHLPFKFGEKSDDPLSMYLEDIYTLPVNLAGLPGLSVPVGEVKEGEVSLPIGAQLIGPTWSEEVLFDLGKQLEV